MRGKFWQLCFGLLVLMFAAGVSADAQTIYGVTTGNQLVRFNATTPGTITSVGAITGLQTGENIVGIDFRPATGQLYGLGSTSRLYLIDRTSGAATQVGAAGAFTLTGTNFGFDFNPVPDRIRIVSNTGQNLRVNPNDGTLTATDTPLNPGTPGVTAAAYTNNFNGATATTLYDIDTNNGTTPATLYIQNPPNNGTLVAVGSLGVIANGVNGFDYSSGNNTAYAALTTGAVTNLYTINLTTGAATLVAPIGTAGGTTLSGLAVEIATVSGLNAIGVTSTNQLIRFNVARSNTATAPVAITGLQTGENIVGIDFRPATGQLYGLGSTSRLYTINPITGAATQVGAAGAFTLTGTNFGFDFNPVPDRIRVVSDSGQNLRLNPNDGTLAATDTPLNPGTPQITAAAYTNSFANSTVTTLFDIDSGSDSLQLQGSLNGTPNSPNGGTLSLVGPLGVDVTGLNGFDISSGNNTAIAALQVNGDTVSKLYSINLSTGTATFIGQPGGATGALLRGFTLVPGSNASRTLDFDGDNRTDFAVYRLSNSTTYVRRNDNTFFGVPFGNSGDIQTPGDYDGDGRTDIAVFRESTGQFFFINSSTNTFQVQYFGQAGDQPVPADYDGDGRTDFAVARRANGALTWFVLNSATNTVTGTQFGLDTDVVAPGDYDGDGRFDLAVYRGSGANPATFFVLQTLGGFRAVQFGQGSDLVVPGDYDGDGRTDFAVVRQGTQFTWYILQSTGGFRAVQFGAKPQLTAQGDYDGDGRTDIATFDPSTGNFFALRSTNATLLVQKFGQNGDIPLANFNSF